MMYAQRRRHDHPEPDFSFQWVVCTVCWGRATTPSESEREPQFIWQLFSSTWALRSSSWPATLPGTIRRPESSPDTCSLPSGTTKNSTSFFQIPCKASLIHNGRFPKNSFRKRIGGMFHTWFHSALVYNDRQFIEWKHVHQFKQGFVWHKLGQT